MCSGKVIVFVQEWLYSGKVISLGQKRYYWCKRGCNRAKWLYSGKSGCIRESGLIREEIVLSGQSGCIRA